jgi:hypothetical protein
MPGQRSRGVIDAFAMPTDTENVCFWQMLLQKSQKAQRLIFRQRTKKAAIANQWGSKRSTRIAGEFGAR